MKRQIATITTIDCNPKTCGMCHFKKRNWGIPQCGFRCLNFNAANGLAVDLEQKPGGAVLRCQQCLDAEIKGANP